MKRYQLHLYLTETLLALLKEKAQHKGLTPSQYVKFILVKDLEAHPINLNIRATSVKRVHKSSGLILPEEQEIF